MSDPSIASIVFICCFGGALIGLVLHRLVPERHLDTDSKDTVKLVMGLIATMSALVLGLLIATAKSSYDAQESGVQQLAAEIIQFDQRLARFGPETREIRSRYRNDVFRVHALVWSLAGNQTGALDPRTSAREFEEILGDIQDLVPKTEAQRNDQAKAVEIGSALVHTRLLMFVATNSRIPPPFLIVLVLWITTLFLGFGLFARFNLTVMVSLLIGALSIAAAIFLILELNHPFSSLLRISDAPIQYALSRLGQ
jgi:Protein of unknown function (DUF4239)